MYIFSYLLDYWIIYKKIIKSLVCWWHLDSYRRVFVCLFLFVFFSAELLKLNFNDTLVSSTRTFPVNNFNLEGGETMLAQDKGNFYAHGQNRTHDPPVQWLERPIFMWYSKGSWVQFSPWVWKFSLSRASMVSPPSKLKMLTGRVCVLLTSVSLKLTKLKIKLIVDPSWSDPTFVPAFSKLKVFYLIKLKMRKETAT